MKRIVLVCALVIVTLLITIEPAIAGPGGRIARAAIGTFWGRTILGILVIVFLPLIVLSLFKERRAVHRASADLAYLARITPAFRWIDLRERALSCFHRVHAAWCREDVSEASAFMTDWYWQNQQLVFLDRWASEGLVNHCNVRSVSRVRPILVNPAGEAPAFEGSKVVLAISADMQDYLARRDSGELVEGSKKYREVETLWTFELADGHWKVSNIDESTLMDEYLQMATDLPRARDTVRARPQAS